MTEKLRTSPITFSGHVDGDVIRGVSVATTGEAVGHRLLFDDATLQQIERLSLSKATGIKSRFTHPDWFHDGLGKYLGRMRNFRIDGLSLRADLHLSPVAYKSPAGDIGSYIKDLALEDPQLSACLWLSTSIVCG